MGALAANLAVAVAVLMTGLSLLMGSVAALAYHRLRRGRLLGIASAFVLFAIKGAWMIRFLVLHRGEVAASWGVVPWLATADMGILFLLYVAVLKD